MERSRATAAGVQNQEHARPATQSRAHRLADLAELASSRGSSNQDAQRTLGAAIQMKLTVNTPGDPFEQEADRMADSVMRMAATENVADPQVEAMRTGAQVQRKCAACEEEEKKSASAIQRKCSNCSQRDGGADVSPEVASRIQSLRGGGQPLPTSARNFFEPRFGRDFSNVRLHTDSESTRSLQARAYTVGRDIVFGAGQYSPQTETGKKLLAHELTHVVQQGAATSQVRSGTSETIQRAGDPAFIPTPFACDTDLTPGRPAGTDILFSVGGFVITAAHTTQLTTFRDAWVTAGGTDDILVHGYASTQGDQEPNWTLSCNRAEAVRVELIRLGIPRVRINVVAHGESTDFGATFGPNQHAVVSSSARGIIQLPIVAGTLTARDNFASRSTVRFGVGEIIDLNFASLPPAPAVDFGGLQWVLVSGGGALVALAPDGTGTYTAPPTPGPVTLELRVASGATAGSVISSHPITIVVPAGVRMAAQAGTAPGTAPGGGTIPAGTWGAGFLADIFVDPRDVSFQGVMFGERTTPGILTGTFLGPAGPHPASPALLPGGPGNATTGTQVTGTDQIATARPASGSLLGIPTCGASTFLWAIPWEFSVAGSPAVAMTRTANHLETSTFLCNATIQKGGAGPFCRRINGTVC